MPRNSAIQELRAILNPTSQRMMTGIALNAIGGGMTLSLLMVYLHDIRGFSNTFNGLALSWGAIVSICFGPFAGWLIDHLGARIVILTGIVCNGIAALSLAFVSTHAQVIAAISLLSAADQAVRPTQNVALTRVTPEEHRSKIFGYRFMFLNLGMGFGGLVSSLIIQQGSLISFQAMYIVDAATFFIYLAIVWGIRGPEMQRHKAAAHEPQRGSY
ncbi:MAG: hypothetical protein RL470_1103, partial [Actinomycetota bacterium]